MMEQGKAARYQPPQESSSEEEEEEIAGNPPAIGLQPVNGVPPVLPTAPPQVAAPVAPKSWFGFGKKEPSQQDEERQERRLRAQIRHLVRINPQIKISELSKDELELKQLCKEELQEVLESILSQLHGPSPYASASTILEAFARVVEGKTKVKNYGSRLKNDLDLIAAFDSMLPSLVSETPAPLVIGWKLGENFLNALQDDGTSAPPSHENPSGRKIPNGKNDLHRESNHGKTKRSSESPDRGLSDVSDAEDVRSSKKLRKA